MNIEKQQLLANPSRAFRENQSAPIIDKSFGGRALHSTSCWCAHRLKARVPGIARLFQLD
jgi:hypothetical protein